MSKPNTTPFLFTQPANLTIDKFGFEARLTLEDGIFKSLTTKVIDKLNLIVMSPVSRVADASPPTDAESAPCQDSFALRLQGQSPRSVV
jgi:hypothetical protein